MRPPLYMNILLRKSRIPMQRETAIPISKAKLEKGLADGSIVEIEPGLYREVPFDYGYQTKVMVPRIKKPMQYKTMAKK